MTPPLSPTISSHSVSSTSLNPLSNTLPELYASTEGFGGGILADSGYTESRLELGGCELSYNRAATGPAVMVVKSSDDTGENLEFYNVTFTGNALLCGSKEFLVDKSNVSRELAIASLVA